MTRILKHLLHGVAVVRLEGELGPERAEDLERALDVPPGDRVLLDLRSTCHLHHRLALRVVRMAQAGHPVGLVGPSPYIRQILRFAGALDGDLREYPDLREALEDEVA